MEKLICLMEDLAMINSQIQKYQDYEKKYRYVNHAFRQRIIQMERRKKALEHDMDILYISM
ncbi:MAG: hypothetical protein IJL70_06890 [Treponema sp.]|nr:hypothetical protein [Treponema sp.]